MSTTTPTLRPELGELPRRLRLLPLDDRGYPVPWFVAWHEGRPEFRAMDRDKWRQAVRERRCWVCGGELGRFLAFVIGPMCGINRTSAEPPCHLDCAQWSARHCPFLSRPRMRRREDDEINAAELAASSPFGLHRNPGAAGVWVTHTFKVFPAPPGHPLIEMGPPVNVEWYAEGRRATRAEVEASIAGGLPELEAMVDQERPEDRPLARAELARAREALAGWLPVEGA